jgi:hypothetical protein
VPFCHPAIFHTFELAYYIGDDALALKACSLIGEYGPDFQDSMVRAWLPWGISAPESGLLTSCVAVSTFSSSYFYIIN